MKIITADEYRRTRFHDMKGHLIPAQDWLWVPVVAAQAARRELFNVTPKVPWIPRGASKAIEKLITPESRVFEFGAGGSTYWFAQRVAWVHSIETQVDWKDQISGWLEKAGLSDKVVIEVRPRGTDPRPWDASSEPDDSYDLVTVDGDGRRFAIPEALRLVKPGGAIYLDNTDHGVAWPEDYGEAETRLLRATKERGAKVQYFTGLAPASFVANEGLLVTGL